MMGVMMKGEKDLLTLQVKGDGPLGGITVTADSQGHVKGYVENPDVLLPATTALGTIHPEGRELGILSGANVCMPNLSPGAVRKNYALYDNKLSDGPEAAESLDALKHRLQAIHCLPDLSRGDHLNFVRN